MKRTLKRLRRSLRHLQILDEFLSAKVPEYSEMENRMDSLGDSYSEFCRQLYYGGNKTRGNPPIGSRQMILSDIFQYIITSRGYYMAYRDNQQHYKDFIKLVLLLVNQWLLMDSFGPKEELKSRRLLIDTLKQKLGSSFFEGGEQYHTDKMEEAYNCSDDIIPKPPNTTEPSSSVLAAYDSLFPKVRGGPIEVLVYLYLVQRSLGFTVSLLTQQRLFTGKAARAPPDILLIRSKGEVIGLEIGRGKEEQSTDFSALTGIPTLSVDLAERQPFRCDSCGKWIIYCKRVVEAYSDSGVPKDHNPTILCAECPYFDNGRCPEIMYHGEETNRYGLTRTARYHYRCIDQDKRTAILEDPEQKESLVAYLPLVDGLESFPEEYGFIQPK